MSRLRSHWSVFALLAVAILAFATHSRKVPADSPTTHNVMIPDEDRFVPFAITIHVGDSIRWINTDTDDHSVVSNDAFNTAGHRGVNQTISGNGGVLVLKFDHTGVFPFYCRFHSMLDKANQPIAPGPDGGIQDSSGNYGTPMNGVITVVGSDN